MPETVPAGEATNAGQPLGAVGGAAYEREFAVGGYGLNPPVAISGDSTPAAE